MALILPIRAYYGALWLIRKGDLWGWQKGLGRTKMVKQGSRMGRGLDDYKGAINRKKTTQKHTKLIRNFTERLAPAMGTFGHRSRGRGALAWAPTAPAPRRRRSQNLRRGQGCGAAALATPLRRLTRSSNADGWFDRSYPLGVLHCFEAKAGPLWLSN